VVRCRPSARKAWGVAREGVEWQGVQGRSRAGRGSEPVGTQREHCAVRAGAARLLHTLQGWALLFNNKSDSSGTPRPQLTWNAAPSTRAKARIHPHATAVLGCGRPVAAAHPARARPAGSRRMAPSNSGVVWAVTGCSTAQHSTAHTRQFSTCCVEKVDNAALKRCQQQWRPGLADPDTTH
jgi:hypothetical protein